MTQASLRLLLLLIAFSPSIFTWSFAIHIPKNNNLLSTSMSTTNKSMNSINHTNESDNGATKDGSHRLANETEMKEQIVASIQNLASRSSAVKTLTLQEQLQIIQEISERLRSKSWSYGDAKKQILLADYESALLQMGPPPIPPPTSSDTASSSSYMRTRHSRESEKCRAYSDMTWVYSLVGALDTHEQRIEYELQKQKEQQNYTFRSRKSTPTLIKRVQPLFPEKDTIGSIEKNNIYIHGPSSLPFMLHNFEVWTQPPPLQQQDPVNSASAVIDVGEKTGLLDDSNQSHNENVAAEEDGGISLILGAGNQSFIGILDILHCLFTHPHKPILFKHHPLRPYLFHPYMELLKPLFDRNLLCQIQDHGKEHTQFLLKQKEVTHVHLTGALSTSNIITNIFHETRPHLSKQNVINKITSELGCASPILITPSKHYTKHQLRTCAKNIVTGKKMNAGSNCLMSQVIILSTDWEQKELFRTLLKQEMMNTPTDPSYYPGSLRRVKEFVEEYHPDNVQQICGPFVIRSKSYSKDDVNFVDDNEHHPYLIECGVVGSKDYNDYALQNEIFGPVLAIVELPQTLPATYKHDDDTYDGEQQLHQQPQQSSNVKTEQEDDTGIEFLVNSALPFVNNKKNIFGSLSCVLMHPTKSSLFSYHEYQQLIKQRVISQLNYGTVNVNTNSLVGYSAMTLGGQWGAHAKDLKRHSGRGYIGNSFMLQNVEKTVVYGRSLSFPFTLLQKRNLLPAFCLDTVTNLMLMLSKYKRVRRLFF